MKNTESLTQQRLKEVLNYDAESGIFTWAVGRRKAAKGVVAGGFSDRGYLNICVDGVRYRAHRLAWLYMYGVYPKQIDHLNHVRHDNRLINLRETDSYGNSRNQSKPSHNTSGVVGVSLSNRIGRNETRWEVKICGKFLGYFDNFFDAVCKRKSAERQFDFHPNHGI
jgi:hypothetical protein